MGSHNQGTFKVRNIYVRHRNTFNYILCITHSTKEKVVWFEISLIVYFSGEYGYKIQGLAIDW